MANVEVDLPDVDDGLTEASWRDMLKLSKDLQKSAAAMNLRAARFISSTYYKVQDLRMQIGKYAADCKKAKDPQEMVLLLGQSMKLCEEGTCSMLGTYAKQWRVGQWIQKQFGFGAVSSAAMLATFDIRQGLRAGNWWSYCGLSPHIEWTKGQKRPFNADLKGICAFRIGETMNKFKDNPKSYYGPFFNHMATRYWDRNLDGQESAIATEGLKDLKGPGTEAWSWKSAEYSSARARLWREECLAIREANRQAVREWKEECVEALAAGIELPGRPTKDETPGILDVTEPDPKNLIPMLPPGQIHNRARRWTVKLFISHLWEVCWEDYYGFRAPDPYCFQLPGAAHNTRIPPAFWPGPYTGRPLSEMYKGHVYRVQSQVDRAARVAAAIAGMLKEDPPKVDLHPDKFTNIPSAFLGE